MPNTKKPVCDECKQPIDGQEWCEFTVRKNRNVEGHFTWHFVDCAFKGLTAMQPDTVWKMRQRS